MGARVLKTTLAFCALAAVGAFAPLAIGQDAEYAVVVRVLRGAGALAFLAGLIVLFRSSGESAPVGDVVYEPPPPAPRVLDSDPLGAGASAKPFDERMDAAIEASARYGRAIGVIYYNLDAYRRIARSSGVPTAEAAMEQIAAALRARLRNTDRIERMGKGRLVVCAVLLADQQSLLSIRDRINTAMRACRIDALGDAPVEFDEGVSLYPLGGYTGADLIAHAQAKCDAAHAARLRTLARDRKTAATNRSAA